MTAPKPAKSSPAVGKTVTTDAAADATHDSTPAVDDGPVTSKLGTLRQMDGYVE